MTLEKFLLLTIFLYNTLFTRVSDLNSLIMSGKNDMKNNMLHCMASTTINQSLLCSVIKGMCGVGKNKLAQQHQGKNNNNKIIN